MNDDQPDDGGPAYTDITCSFCGRHNRVVHMVGGGDLTICSICVSKAGAVLDVDAGVTGPAIDWPNRWALKREDPGAT